MLDVLLLQRSLPWSDVAVCGLHNKIGNLTLVKLAICFGE
jgi:hypothetical protein